MQRASCRPLTPSLALQKEIDFDSTCVSPCRVETGRITLYVYFYTLSQKKFTRVACYNFDIHEPILIILNEIAPFHLNAACSFANKHEKQAKYQLYGKCSKLKFHCQNYRQYYLNKC